MHYFQSFCNFQVNVGTRDSQKAQSSQFIIVNKKIRKILNTKELYF